MQWQSILAVSSVMVKVANILFLKYEDMKRDLAGVVGQIADFVEVPLNQMSLERVVAGSSFRAMTTNEKTNFNWMPQREGTPGQYRKGLVGEWRNQLSPEQSHSFDEVYSQKMSGTNLQFDFGDGLIL